MSASKAHKVMLTDLDKASKEYETLIKQTENVYVSWEAQKDRSFNLIGRVEDLSASISHAPFTISRKLKKLTVQREDYQGREAIEREKRKEDLLSSTTALAVLGAGAAAAVSYWEYVAGFVSKRTGGKIGKNHLAWLIVIVLILIASVFLLIGWAINRWRTAKKAEMNTKKLLKSIAALQEKKAISESLTIELDAQCGVVDQYLEALEQYRGSNFKDISKDVQNDLVQMVNEAILLSELMSKESK